MDARTVFFAPYAPDAARYGGGFSPTVSNVVPVDAREGAVTYGPVRSLSAYSSALTGRAQGAYSKIASSGDVYLFAGDATKLNMLTVASTSWADVSKAAGYSTDPEDWWTFTSYGDQVIATNYTNPIQAYTIGTSTDFADLAGAAPRAKYCAVVRDFLVVGHTVDGTSGARPQRVWWSAIGDPTSWPTPGTIAAALVQSDYQDVAGSHGDLRGIVPGIGNYDALLVFERALFGMQYVGPPAIFSLTQIENAKGSLAPMSLVAENGLLYYLGDDGFRVTDGGSSKLIGFNRVDDEFRTQLLPAEINRVVGASDPLDKCIKWIFPGDGSSNSIPNKMLAYNYAVDQWSLSSVDAEIIFKAITFGYSLEGLAALYPDLETVPASLDSPVWAGGYWILGGFTTTHALAYFSGDALTPSVDTPLVMANTFDPRIPENTMHYVSNLRPIYEGVNFEPTVACGVRDHLGEEFSFGSAVEMDSRGNCWQRKHGQQSVARVSGSGPFKKLVGVDFDIVPTGKR